MIGSVSKFVNIRQNPDFKNMFGNSGLYISTLDFTSVDLCRRICKTNVIFINNGTASNCSLP